MANITIFVNPYCDMAGTHKVSYRLSINGKSKVFDSGVRVRESDLTRDLHIKDYRLLSELEKKRLELLDRVYSMELKSLGVRNISAEWVVNKILSVPAEQEFFAYANRWLDRCTLRGRRNYVTMLNKLEKFLGHRYLPFINITYDMLVKFEQSMSSCPRAKTMYIAGLRHIYREAMRELNTDYEKVIHDDPFTRYRAPRQQPRTSVRALEVADIINIYNFKAKPRHRRAQTARDCFILSFCLMGMNSADLYDCSDMSRNTIRYCRVKTRNRRADKAYIEVAVHPFIQKLVRKYRGCRRVFKFSQMYTTPEIFNRELNTGLKEVGKEVGIPTLSFYQARHTFATLSRNLLRIAKSDVDEALNHIGSLELADIYIKKDFTIINENNTRLIETVFADYIKK